MFKIIDDTTAEYRTIDDHCLLATVQWDMIGVYSESEWYWAWSVVPPKPGTRPDVVRKVIQSTQALAQSFTQNDHIHFKSNVLVGYLLAKIADVLKYQYVHIQPASEPGMYMAFGIRSVQWAPYDADAHKVQLYYSVISGVRN
jgi:hypothetical protein